MAGSLYDMRATPLVVGRMPALPIQIALQILQSPDPYSALRDLLARNEFARSAIEVASPSLAGAIADWIAGRPLRNAKTPLRALAYVLRMCARPTPYGLCASVGRVSPATQTSLAVDEDPALRRTYTRPDMELLSQLADELLASDLAPQVRYIANSCSFVRGGRLYVTDVTLLNMTHEKGTPVAKQRAVSLKHTEAVAFVLDLCSEPVSQAAIEAALRERFGVEHTAARRLFEQLRRAGVLLSELRPSPIGDAAATLVRCLEDLGAPFAPQLREALTELEAFDARPLHERGTHACARVSQRLASLASGPVANAVQVDSRAYFSGTLGTAVLADVERLAEYAVRTGPVARLESMRKRFFERYEGAERLVPLLELIDENAGIGIGTGIDYERSDRAARDALLVRLACDAQRTGAHEIELDEQQLRLLAPAIRKEDYIPHSLEIAFQIAARSAQDVDEGRYLIVPSGMGLSDAAGKSVGRFAQMLGAEFSERLGRILSQTCSADALAVEFGFSLRDPRAYNVSMRPNFYEHSLEAGVWHEHDSASIRIDDLWVGVEGGRFYLWSKSLGRRVDIRETHAFATPFGAPDLCRFLSMLRYDGMRVPAFFDWGGAAEFTYLPRVRVGRIVLAPRRWKFTAAAFETDEQFAALCDDWKLPAYAYLCREDQRLLVDCRSSVAGSLLRDQSAGEESVELIEALPAPEDFWVRSSGGTHAVEFVALGVAAPRETAPWKPRPAALVDRRAVHGPGSDWTFAKLYAGPQAADNLLVSRVAPLVRELSLDGLFDRWFFVRYGDPDFHIRLRMHASANCNAMRARIIDRLEEWLQQQVIQRWALDTYVPEVERYGVESMDLVERFFGRDSDVCLALLENGLGGDLLVEAAAGTFYAHLHGTRFSDLAIEAFAAGAHEKLSQADRSALRRICARVSSQSEALPEGVMRCENPRRRLSDLLHMRCNRLGLEGDEERRVRALVRAASLAQRAKMNAREPHVSGPRA